jgi:BolA family transcriptional regulator, general stress-responsive regulator
MNTFTDDLKQKLQDTFNPQYIELINDSSNHNVPAGSESHFTLILVSEQFEGKSRIQKHRLVNEALANELKTQIHALSLKLFSPSEYEKLESVDTTQPPCLGGDKS